MANLTIDRQKAELGMLGSACICCGAHAQTLVQHDFYWRPTWFVIMRVFLGRLVRAFFWQGTQYVTCRVPVCAKHTKRLSLPTYVAFGVIGWLVVGTILSIGFQVYASSQERPGETGGIVAALFFLPMLVIGPGAVFLQVQSPRAEDFDDRSISFVAVSPQFAASASGRAVAAPAASSGYGGAASGSGGQPSYGGQPNYGGQAGYGGQSGYGGQAGFGSPGGYGGAPAAFDFPAPAAPRVWSDITGQHRIQATFVRIDGTFIELQRTDGRTIRMPLAQLCAQDQAFAQSQSIF